MTNNEKLKSISVEEFIKLFSSKPCNEVLPYLICVWFKKCDFCVLNGKCSNTATDNLTEYYSVNCIQGIKEYLEKDVENENKTVHEVEK